MSELVERYRWLIVFALAAPLFIGLGFLLHQRLSGPEPLEIDVSDVPPKEIRVYIIGAVQRPGVYPLEEGDRWIDALEAAGGPTVDADLAAVNLARRARDEDHIVVPRLGEEPAGVAGASQSPRININTATEAELDTLPGIGEVRSARIVESRNSDGPFASTEELVTRKLIPRSVYEDIKDMITVGPAASSGQGP